MLVQLIYLSTATQQFSSSDLVTLLTNARLKNELLGITGMLLYHEETFLQILEGQDDIVDELYSRIANDPRHKKCEVILRSYIDHRSFAQWKMGFVNTNQFRDTTLIKGFQDFHVMKHEDRQPDLAHQLLLGFRDGMLKQSQTNVEDFYSE